MISKNIIVRTSHISDISSIYNICLATAAEGKDATSFYCDPLLVGHYYAAPYFFYSAQYCFVVGFTNKLNQLIRPLGYILACPDTIQFSQWMKAEWLPVLRPRYALNEFAAKTLMEKGLQNLIIKNKCPGYCTDNVDILKNYPAQFHIDILPELQKKGCGKVLVTTLLKKLKENHIKGVHLGVSAKNENAIGFYKAMNFSILEEKDWGYVMGILL